ncbi:hypothetical protein TNCV_330091 [Trichonephila clavipes]|nr:hypothetical protein TNCV_330091 [Trichonephila clavipes]
MLKEKKDVCQGCPRDVVVRGSVLPVPFSHELRSLRAPHRKPHVPLSFSTLPQGVKSSDQYWVHGLGCGGHSDFLELFIPSIRINTGMVNHISCIGMSSVGAPYYNPSRTPIARSAPMLFTSTTPGGFYDEY